MSFIEKSPIEAGFAQVYATKVAPALRDLETQRLETVKKSRMFTALGLVVGIALAALMAWLFEDLTLFLFLMVGVGIGVYNIPRIFERMWSGGVAEKIMPHVCDFVGDLSYDRRAMSAFTPRDLERLSIVPSYSSATMEDHLKGTWNGTDYELTEATLTSSSGESSSVIVFEGLLFRIALPNPAPTTILIMRNHGKKLNKLAGALSFGKGRGMPRVETGHTAFEHDFELHAEHPEGVLDYLSPALLDTLVAVGASVSDRGAKGMLAGFSGTDFWMSLERSEPFMEITSFKQPVSEITTELHEVFDDIQMVRDIITKITS